MMFEKRGRLQMKHKDVRVTKKNKKDYSDIIESMEDGEWENELNIFLEYISSKT